MTRFWRCDPKSTLRDPGSVVRESTLSNGAIDVLDQRIDRGHAPGRIGALPAIGAKASAHLRLRPISKIVHRLVDDCRARAFSDGVPDTQDPSAPRIIASEYRCGSQRNERVHER